MKPAAAAWLSEHSAAARVFTHGALPSAAAAPSVAEQLLPLLSGADADAGSGGGVRRIRVLFCATMPVLSRVGEWQPRHVAAFGLASHARAL